MRHLPTGIEVKVDGRDQHANRRLARARLEERVLGVKALKQEIEIASKRKHQVGSGMRGDKIRTYRERDDVVIDHVSERKLNFKRVTSGHLDG